MTEKMPPPGLTVVIGAHPKGDMPSNGKMQPPGAKDMPKTGEDGKVSPEDAGVVLDSQHCGDCQMWHGDTGECDKVTGVYSPNDGCHEYFLAIDKDKEEEPDEDDAPPFDADDQQEMQ